MRQSRMSVEVLRCALMGALLLSGAARAQVVPPPGYYPATPSSPYGAQPAPSVYPSSYPQQAPPPSRGQIELGGFVGWTVSTDASTPSGSIVIDGAVDYGGLIDYSVRPGYGVELLYAYVPTKARFVSFNPGAISSSESAGLGLHYIQLGGVVGRPLGRVEPFGALTAGIVIVHPSAVKFQDGTTYTGEDSVRFAFTAGLGLKVWMTEQVGLRFEARALVPVYFSGGGFYVGTGGGGVGLSGGIPYAQFDFTGGISVRF